MPARTDQGGGSGYNSTPVPDPTVLTTQALYREVAALQELIEFRLDALSALMDEKFRTNEQQFELVERQRVESKEDAKDALNAALQAAKEAVDKQTVTAQAAIDKSETAFSKQLDQLTQTFRALAEDLRRTLDELKERIGEVDKRVLGVEQRTAGVKESTTERLQANAATWAIAAVVVAALGLIALVVGVVLTHHG